LHDAVESGVRDCDDFLTVGHSVSALASAGRTTGADPDNLPDLSTPWDFRDPTFCAQPLPR
jgi:hypothetical protein